MSPGISNASRWTKMITTVELIYPRDAVRQHLRYGSLYGTGIAAATTQASR